MDISMSQLKNLIRVGRVSTVNAEDATCTVTYTDKDDLVSAELPVLQLGTKSNKTYWLPDVDTLVYCVFAPNPSGKGISAGAVIGCAYNDEDAPEDNDINVKSIRFADGSYIKYDNGDLTIHMTGTVTITADTINLN